MYLSLFKLVQKNGVFVFLFFFKGVCLKHDDDMTAMY